MRSLYSYDKWCIFRVHISASSKIFSCLCLPLLLSHLTQFTHNGSRENNNKWGHFIVILANRINFVQRVCLFQPIFEIIQSSLISNQHRAKHETWSRLLHPARQQFLSSTYTGNAKCQIKNEHESVFVWQYLVYIFPCFVFSFQITYITTCSLYYFYEVNKINQRKNKTPSNIKNQINYLSTFK